MGDAKDNGGSVISRRHALAWLGGSVALAPLTQLLGCTSQTGNRVGQTGDASTGDGSVSEGSDAGDRRSTGDDGGTSGGWASGGTMAMVGIASYPNPFEDVPDVSCTPTCQMTLGPCHDDQAPEREDISEGQTGLPMRLGLRIVDAECKPVTDADVDIWHCDVRGVYSSETADNPPFCTGDDDVALAARWFRGHRKTDKDGIAWFNSCFPGWYNGRAIHIHLTVRRSSRDGDEYLTSQIAFPVSLIDDVCKNHVDYKSHGLPSTANASDSVFPADSVDEYVVDTRQMSDGALLAWKTIVIRSALGDSVCSAGGGGGPGGGMP